MTFTPLVRRKTLLSEIGIQRQLQKSKDAAREHQALGSNGQFMLSDGLYCLIVGLESPGLELVEKAQDWLCEAISDQERPKNYTPYFEESCRHHHLALSRWILSNANDEPNNRVMLSNLDAYEHSQQRHDLIEASLLLANYADANAWEAVGGILGKTRNFSPPNAPDSVKTGATMAYVLARHHLGMEYSEFEVKIAFKSYLDRRMDELLGGGHVILAATWLKIAYWNPNPAIHTSCGALLKCYDHLSVSSPLATAAKPKWRFW